MSADHQHATVESLQCLGILSACNAQILRFITTPIIKAHINQLTSVDGVRVDLERQLISSNHLIISCGGRGKTGGSCLCM